MKKTLLFFLFFLISFSGCSFLRGGDKLSDAEDFQEEVLDEEDQDEMWEDEDFGDIEDEVLSEDESEEWDADEEWDTDEEWEEEADEGSEKKGFLSRLFGGKDDEEPELEEEESPSDLAKDYNDYEIVDDSGEPDLYVETPIEGSDEESASQEIEPPSPTIENTVDSLETSPEVADSSLEASESPAEPPVRKSLNKIIKYPYTKNGSLVNAVYIARPNDSLKSISQLIYSQDKTEDLLKINTHLKDRALVVGDKIYYNSPRRPTDNTRLLFYYEDNNRAPSYYSLSPGENIREVSYRLLGHAKSWKEIWATNVELESKGNIDQSLRIAYWPENQAVLENQAMDNQAPIANQAPTANQAMDNQVESLPEPIQEPSQPSVLLDPPLLTEPPEEAPETEINDSVAVENVKNKGFLDKIISTVLKELEIFLGVFAFIIIVILLIRIILRKKNQKDFDYTATNIEV